jgi:hypothetical protein
VTGRPSRSQLYDRQSGSQSHGSTAAQQQQQGLQLGHGVQQVTQLNSSLVVLQWWCYMDEHVNYQCVVAI